VFGPVIPFSGKAGSALPVFRSLPAAADRSPQDCESGAAASTETGSPTPALRSQGPQEPVSGELSGVEVIPSQETRSGWPRLQAEDYNPGFPAPSGKLPRYLMLQQRTRQENRHRRTLRRVWAGQHS